MKRLFITGLGSLMAMAYASPPDIDRGLNASLEDEALKGGTSVELATSVPSARGVAGPGRVRTLADSLKSLGAENVTEAINMGLSGKVIAVHKKDTEGVCLIDAFSGRILPEQSDLPDWVAETGAVWFVLGERHIFYSKRLGEQYTPEMRLPEAMAFEDCDVLCINPETGEETLLLADDEHRMDVLAGALGIDREQGTIEGASATLEMSYDNSRTGEEMAAFTEAQGRVFEKEQKTSTAG